MGPAKGHAQQQKGVFTPVFLPEIAFPGAENRKIDAGMDHLQGIRPQKGCLGHPSHPVGGRHQGHIGNAGKGGFFSRIVALHIPGAIALGILAKLGLTTDVLNCGAARPMSGKANVELIKKGERPQAVHNACSGKHSQILALCQMMGLPVEDYIKPDHPAQKVIFQHVAMASCMPEDKLEIGIDGCGVPVFYLPLDHMARAYARLGSPDKGEWGEYEAAARTIRDAMAAHPDALAGTGRIDTAISQVTGGRVIAKIGADAVYCMAVKDENMGIAFKVEDGDYGAVNPAVMAVLKYMDILTKDEYEQLLAKYPPVLKNHRGDVIGTIEYKL